MSKLKVGVLTSNGKLSNKVLRLLQSIEGVEYEAVKGNTYQGEFFIDARLYKELEYKHKGELLHEADFFGKVKEKVEESTEEEVSTEEKLRKLAKPHEERITELEEVYYELQQQQEDFQGEIRKLIRKNNEAYKRKEGVASEIQKEVSSVNNYVRVSEVAIIAPRQGDNNGSNIQNGLLELKEPGSNTSTGDADKVIKDLTTLKDKLHNIGYLL